MSDIKERLRTANTCHEAGNACRAMEAKSGCMCAEAADEIERLRCQVIGWCHTHQLDWAEIEKLRTVLQRLTAHIVHEQVLMDNISLAIYEEACAALGEK